MKQLVIRSRAIGSAALESLQAASPGQAAGQTSGGVFLRTEADRILFLSFATWHGPLTINLSPADREGLHIDFHSPYLVQANSIVFPEEHIKIEFGQAEHWSPPPRPSLVLSIAERAGCFKQISTAVTTRRAACSEPGQDAISNLDSFSGMGLSGLSSLRGAVVSSEPGKIIAVLVSGLGRGPGLTPAGDDLVHGFLLALNRWGDLLAPNIPPEPFNLDLAEAARQRTTALSASLIECAARGLADERLITALDGLVSGNLAEDRIVERLLDWGHTSGAAALQGMGLVIA